ncbi:hypothetical protein R6254_01195 [Polaromonas sp. SM01]|nr:hypothetical protein [Polaromonas sp. SM01]
MAALAMHVVTAAGARPPHVRRAPLAAHAGRVFPIMSDIEPLNPSSTS